MLKQHKLLHIFLLAVLFIAQPAGPANAQTIGPASLQNTLIPAANLLNPDGSLRLDTHSTGSVDLAGWDVHMDANRGPIFSQPRQPEPRLPPIVIQFFGWFGLGSNGAPANGSLNGRVYAVAVSGSDVYVGGNFTDVNDNGTVLTAADYVAKWDGSHWSALGSNGAGNGSLNNMVFAIVVSGSNVYVGGEFYHVNNGGTVLANANSLAKWDGISWSGLGSSTSGLASGTVFALAASGTNLYAGGTFSYAINNGTILFASQYLAKWDGAQWSALGYGASANKPVFNGYIRTIAISGTNIYVGGEFTNANNKGALLKTADYVARWDGSNWSALGSNGAGNGSLNGRVFSIAVSGTSVYVGGEFSNVNDNGNILGAADAIARWNGSKWSALGDNGGGNGSLYNCIVDHIAVSGNNVYASGPFAYINNHGTNLYAADWIVRWNGTDWSALGNNGIGGGSLNGEVNSFVISGNKLYVGGNFTDANSGGTVHTEADYIAEYINPNWSYASAGGNDGWILESGPGSAVGGSLNATAATFIVGDHGSNRQYRSILHFDTSNLPDSAVVIGASLKIEKQLVTGSDPFPTFGGLLVDIAKLPFSGNPLLETGDFQAASSKDAVATFGGTAAGGWYTAIFKASAFPLFNRKGPTEFRLRFSLATNSNSIADYVRFYSGDAATAGDRPVLNIVYYVP